MAQSKLKVDDNSVEDVVAVIDVSAEAANPPWWGVRRELRGVDFDSAGTFQEFEVPFTVEQENLPLEYRVWFKGVTGLAFEKVIIQSRE